MEADSQISGNKTIENKSILSFNYIYKKVIIKDNLKNTISEIRALNYEKIAKYKMKNMNLKFLLNTIFKLKSSINRNNPLFKYIKNVQSYNYKNLKIDISSENTPLFDILFKKNIKKQYPKKEKILNFSASAQNFKSFYYSRMSNIESKKINNNKIAKIILIQKHVRGFLSKKIFDEEVNKIIVKIIIQKILKLQKAIREFLNKKKSLSHYIVNIIQNERYTKSNKITDIFSLYHYRNKYKKNLLIKKILKARYESILKIQNKFKSYILLKKVKEIINKGKNSYVLTYPFDAESVQIKIYMDTSFKIYDYYFCPIRKYFVLYIEKRTLNSREYLCHMIVNNNIILDKRYKYIVDKNNVLYNLIYIGEPPIKPAVNPPVNQIKNPISDIPKIEKRNKRKKSKNKNIIDDNDFFFYCYNENSNSTNSYSTKSENKINNNNNNNNIKVNTIDKIKVKKVDNSNLQTKKFLKKKYIKKNISLESSNKHFDFLKKNTGDSNNKKYIESNDIREYFTKKLSKKNQLKDNEVYLYESHIYKKADSIQSQKIYNNILDELSSVGSLSRSNFSMRNLNSYSKKTHRAKFCSNNKAKNSSNQTGLNNSKNMNNLYLKNIVNSKYKNIKIKK